MGVRELAPAFLFPGRFSRRFPFHTVVGAPPGNLYGYQKKRLKKFAFRKCMILKEMSLAEQNEHNESHPK
jgi:hypothetical protein